MKTIVIISADGRHWRRYKDFAFDNWQQAESPESIESIRLSAAKDGTDKTCFFELVGQDYFETFGKPYA